METARRPDLYVDVNEENEILEELPPVEITPLASIVPMSFVFDAVEQKTISGIIQLQYHVRKHQRKNSVAIATTENELREWQSTTRGKVAKTPRQPSLVHIDSKQSPRSNAALKITTMKTTSGGHVIQRSGDNDKTIRGRLPSYPNVESIISSCKPQSTAVQIDSMQYTNTPAQTMDDANSEVKAASVAGVKKKKTLNDSKVRRAKKNNARPGKSIEPKELNVHKPKTSKNLQPSTRRSPTQKKMVSHHLTATYSPPKFPPIASHSINMSAEEIELTESIRKACLELKAQQIESDRLKQLYMERNQSDFKPGGHRELDIQLEHLQSERKSLLCVTKRQKESIDANEWEALLQKTMKELESYRKKIQVLKCRVPLKENEEKLHQLENEHVELKEKWKSLTKCMGDDPFLEKAVLFQSNTAQEIKRIKKDIKRIQNEIKEREKEINATQNEKKKLEEIQTQEMNRLPQIRKPHTGDIPKLPRTQQPHKFMTARDRV